MAKKDRSKDAGPRGRNDAYTVMLFVTLLAIGIGCTLLYLDYDEYGKNAPPKEAAPTLPKLGGEGAAPPAPGGTSSGMGKLEQPPLARPKVAAARPLIRPGAQPVLLPVAIHRPVEPVPAEAPVAPVTALKPSEPVLGENLPPVVEPPTPRAK